MYVRLAFSLATTVRPEILIIDEALSVGDAYFQQKCVKRMLEFKDKGMTILFVSHDLGMLKLFCDRVALLHKGKIESVGGARSILDLYNAKLAENNEGFVLRENIGQEKLISSGNGKASITQVSINTKNALNVAAVEAGQDCVITINIDFLAEISNPAIGILIRDRLGYDIFGTNTKNLFLETGRFQKNEKVEFQFKFPMNLGPGEYTLTAAIHKDATHASECYHWIDRIVSFKVIPRTDFQFLGVSLLKPQVSYAKQDFN